MRRRFGDDDPSSESSISSSDHEDRPHFPSSQMSPTATYFYNYYLLLLPLPLRFALSFSPPFCSPFLRAFFLVLGAWLGLQFFLSLVIHGHPRLPILLLPTCGDGELSFLLDKLGWFFRSSVVSDYSLVCLIFLLGVRLVVTDEEEGYWEAEEGGA